VAGAICAVWVGYVEALGGLGVGAPRGLERGDGGKGPEPACGLCFVYASSLAPVKRHVRIK
jgi:hypothetical protein